VHFAVDPWADASGRLIGADRAHSALVSLRWALTSFEAPQPIAIDLSGITDVRQDFLEGFFAALVQEWPESHLGRHTIVVVGVDATLAPKLRAQFRDCRFEAPVCEQA
jgi:hypothetical protein